MLIGKAHNAISFIGKGHNAILVDFKLLKLVNKISPQNAEVGLVISLENIALKQRL